MKAKKMKTSKLKVPKIERTSHGLRVALFDEIDGIRDGSSTPTKANTLAKMVSSVVGTVQMELNVAKFLQRGHKSAPRHQTLQLARA